MKTHDVAPRPATTDRKGIRREGRILTRGFGAAAAVAVAALVIALASCSPGASTVPLGSAALPSVDVSAGASFATEAAVAALDQVDSAIALNQSSGALTADEAKSLQDLSTGVRTALQTGNVTEAKMAAEALTAKADGFAAKLSGDAGQQLKAAIAALKAALPSS
jgi:hypothetical protein